MAASKRAASPGQPIVGASLTVPKERFQVIERDARVSRTFPRFFGFNSSVALWNAAELKQQFKLHQEATEELAVKDTLMQALFGGIGGSAFFFSGLLMVLQRRGEDEITGGINGVMAVVVVAVIAAMGLGGGWFIIGGLAAARVRYSAVYGETIIVDRSRQAKGGKITVGHTNLKRLGFIARSAQGYFFGPTQEASVSKGIIVLEVGKDSPAPVTEMMVGDLYDLGPGKGDLTGGGPSDCYACIQRVESAGEMELRLRKKRVKDLLQTGGLVLIGVVAIIAILIQAQSGFEIDPTNIQLPDITNVVK